LKSASVFSTEGTLTVRGSSEPGSLGTSDPGAGERNVVAELPNHGASGINVKKSLMRCMGDLGSFGSGLGEYFGVDDNARADMGASSARAHARAAGGIIMRLVDIFCELGRSPSVLC